MTVTVTMAMMMMMVVLMMMILVSMRTCVRRHNVGHQTDSGANGGRGRVDRRRSHSWRNSRKGVGLEMEVSGVVRVSERRERVVGVGVGAMGMLLTWLHRHSDGDGDRYRLHHHTPRLLLGRVGPGLLLLGRVALLRRVACG